MAGNVENGDDYGCIEETDSPSYYSRQFSTVSHSSGANKGSVKIEVCKFCDKNFKNFRRYCCSQKAVLPTLKINDIVGFIFRSA